LTDHTVLRLKLLLEAFDPPLIFSILAVALVELSTQFFHLVTFANKPGENDTSRSNQSMSDGHEDVRILHPAMGRRTAMEQVDSIRIYSRWESRGGSVPVLAVTVTF